MDTGDDGCMPLAKHESLCKERQKIIVSRDKDSVRQHIANNVNSALVNHYRLDGVVQTTGRVCDYLLINEDSRTAYLIELKGSNLGDAAKQLEETETFIKPQLSGYTLLFRIVASKCSTHEIESTGFRKFKLQKKEKLRYKTNKLEEDI
jgi:hypothetical protein